MFVRQLIGPGAGTIIEVPYAVGQSLLMNGTAQAVTEQEIVDAGLDPEPKPVIPPEEQLVSGYQFVINQDVGGYDVVDPTGIPLTLAEGTPGPFPNLLQAKHFAVDHARAARNLPERTDEERENREAVDAKEAARQNLAEPGDARDAVEIPEDWETIHHSKRRAIARELTGEEPENTAAADEIIRAELARRSGEPA